MLQETAAQDPTNIYVALTREFNAGGRIRAVISSGQAVVLHRLAIMSKDGDWILKEDEESLDHVLRVLAQHGARYRYGAPLDLRWMRGGWSAHFEFRDQGLRVRTDFVTRPARISPEELVNLWKAQEGRDLPVVDVLPLIEIKKTNREKDYAIIGELARRLQNPTHQILCSRSARDLMLLAEQHRELVGELGVKRPVLGAINQGRDALEAALDAERRRLMRANEMRLLSYMTAAEPWGRLWPELSVNLMDMPLQQAHDMMVRHAGGVLPYAVEDSRHE